MEAPSSLAKAFNLDSFEARWRRPEALRRLRAGEGGRVRPFLRVLPMGWSWVLHLCQLVTERAARE
eukprot:7924516-Lingulodinium_polyedra.AAC.1